MIMEKKLLSVILLFLFMPLFSFAGVLDKDPIFGKFGFENHSSFESFQKYIGKNVMYIPCKPLNFAESDVFKTQKFVAEAEYEVLDITPRSGYISSYDKVTITFKEKNSKKKLKMKAYADLAYEYPFIFIDDFNTEKETLIGKKYTDPLVKGAYIITDVKLEKPIAGNRLKDIVYYVNNNEINRSFITSNVDKTVNDYIAEDKLGSYHSTLVKVEKPENSSERYGEVKSIKEEGVTKYSFEDELIDIIIFGESTQFSFKLKNKSQNSIKVVWDDAVFVDCSGSTSKVMHLGIKYSQREASQPASTIIRGASLEDVACPTSNVRYSELLKEWVTESMYPDKITKEAQQIRLMLPIQIRDVVNEYVFVYVVKYESKHPERLNIE